MYYGPRKRVEELNAPSKEIDIVANANKIVAELQEQINDILKEHYKERIAERQANKRLQEYVTTLTQVVKLQTTVLEKQLGRKRYAERFLCTVKNCVLREPPIGTYKTSDSDADVDRIMDRIHKLQEDELKEMDSVDSNINNVGNVVGNEYEGSEV